MYLALVNLTGAALAIPGVGSFNSSTSVQRVPNIGDDYFEKDSATDIIAADALLRLKAAGSINYQFHLDAFDVGKRGVMKLRLVLADLADTAAGTFIKTGPDAFPAGAQLESATLRKLSIAAGGGASTAVLDGGTSGAATAFSSNTNVLAATGRVALTTMAVGGDIGGVYPRLTLDTDVNVNLLTSCDQELIVCYTVVPEL